MPFNASFCTCPKQFEMPKKVQFLELIKRNLVRKKNAHCMEKQNRLLFLGCPSMFLFALVASNLKGKKRSFFFFFFPIERNLVRKMSYHLE